MSTGQKVLPSRMVPSLVRALVLCHLLLCPAHSHPSAQPFGTRQMLRLAEMLNQPGTEFELFPSVYRQQQRLAVPYSTAGIKRQTKETGVAGFHKMDAFKNNMMRALINLRRYRRNNDEAQ